MPCFKQLKQWAQVTGSHILAEYQGKLPVTAAQQWNAFLQEVVSAPTLEAFKRNLDNHLADIL